eukprot:gb/GECG01001743.1/.p1 GENE.gb/GECG01001743.1/~~gb/GECG01001743.1/.p1  ORF type:complete len:403 (+),score=56.21 gb/GECG01001743.1/:1-1209(+)
MFVCRSSRRNLSEQTTGFKTALGRQSCRVHTNGDHVHNLYDGIATVPERASCLKCSCINHVLSCSDDSCDEETHPKQCPPDFKKCGNMYYRRSSDDDCEFPPCPDPDILAENTDDRDAICPTDTHLCQSTGELVHRQARLDCQFECADDDSSQPIDRADLTDEEKKEIEMEEEDEDDDDDNKEEEEEQAEKEAAQDNDIDEMVEVPAHENSNDSTLTVQCPNDIQQCPDGTFLSRVGKDCHFPACHWELPEVNEFWEKVLAANETEQRDKYRDQIMAQLPGGLGLYRFMQRGCKYGDKVLRHGWKGSGQDADTFCNTCECKDGTVECTRFVCDEPFFGSRHCETPDGNQVLHGWIGQGTGDDWCKPECKCNDGRYCCTRGVCPDKLNVTHPEVTRAQCQSGD